MNESELLATMKARHANLIAEARRLEKAMAALGAPVPTAQAPKKRGRPKGSVNKVAATEPEHTNGFGLSVEHAE